MVLNSAGLALPFSIGDTLYLDYAIREENTRDRQRLTLRDTTGRLLVWMGDDFLLSELDPPAELSLENGPELCAQSDDCELGSSQYALKATIEGTSETLLYGEEASLGGFRIAHGGLNVATAGQGFNCPRDHVGPTRASVSLWALPRGLGGPP